MIDTDLTKVDESLLNTSEEMQKVFDTLTGKRWRNKDDGSIVMVTNFGIIDNSMNISLSNGRQVTFSGFKDLYEYCTDSNNNMKQINPGANAMALLENMDAPQMSPPIPKSINIPNDVYVDDKSDVINDNIKNAVGSVDEDTMSILRKAKKSTISIFVQIDLEGVIDVETADMIGKLFDISPDDYTNYSMNSVDLNNVMELIKLKIKDYYDKK